MGIVAGIAMAATAATKMAGSIEGASAQSESAAAKMAAAETSRILEAAFFDEEVGGIIAESARLVGAAEAEAGVRGVKSTTGTAATRIAEIRAAGRRELRTAAQETVLTRHGFTQASKSAELAGRAARVQGGLSMAGVGLGAISSMSADFTKRKSKSNDQVGTVGG